MPFSISQFRGQLRGDGARPNLFEVIINKPPTLAIGSVPQSTSFMIRAASIPSSQVGVIPAGYMGLKAKLAGDRTFDDWAVTVYNDEDFAVRSLFERWVDAASSPNGIEQRKRILGATANPLSYVADCDVIQYGKAGNIIGRYRFFNMFPHVVSQMELDWDANDQIQMFQTVLSYDWFEKI